MRRKPKPYKVGDPLTPKQQKWIDEYIKCDDLTTASRNAGYKGNDDNLRAMGYQNKLKFKELLDARREELNEAAKRDAIAELEDISETKMNDRLKASEYLAKAKGAFIEKRQVQVVETDWFVE